jgi:hypothetical protein
MAGVGFTDGDKGDITISSSGTVLTIDNDAVTYAKIQNVSATDRLLGRSSSGSGDVEEITCTSFGRSLISSADAPAARTALSVQPTASPAFTGAATFANTGDVVPLTVTNAGTANSFVVNDASGDTSPFVIDAAGNVGIGVSSPTHKIDCGGEFRLRGTGPSSEAGKLHLYYVSATNRATITTGSSGEIIVETGASSPATRLTISSTGTATFAGQIVVTAGSVSACSVAASGDPNSGLYFPSADVAAWVTNGTERVRIGSGGRVQFFAADEKFGVQLNKGATGNGPFIGSDGADIFTISTSGGAERVRVDASGNVGIGATPTQRLHVVRSGTGIAARFTDNSTQTLDIGVTASAGVYYDNPNSGYHEWQIGGSGKMRLTGGAELLIGTTTDNGAYLLQVNSQIYATNATIATSDARFKTHVESLTDATSVIEALRPVAFDFIPQEDRNFATERQVGLIAQEAQAALAGIDYADSVVAQCGDHLGLAYEKLVPVLIKALQESNARIAALEERING